MDRRRFIGISLASLLDGRSGLAQQVDNPSRYPSTAGRPDRTDPSRLDGLVNAREFGALGNNAADDTAAIQAAIDYSYDRSRAGVYLPAGKYRISSPLFLDPPGNLRAGLSAPTKFAFSLAIVGDPGLGNQEGFGTQIFPTAGNFVALWVGTGQGMHVRSISIIGPSGVHRALLSHNGCGIAIAGGPGGASRTLIEHCEVANYYHGIATSFNGVDQLCDSNTFVKCIVDNCYRGVSFLWSQNFINSLYDCNVTNCGTAISSPPHVLVNVVGGNYSNSGASRKRFAISGISALTGFSDVVAGNTFTNYRFTATVSSPDLLMQGAGYGACAINTTGFGVVPVRLESFNVGTGTATFSFWPYWRFSTFGPHFDVIGSSDLEAEVQAAATLYACEWVTVFLGGQFSVRGIHLENPNSLTTVISATNGSLATNYFNYDITHSDLATSSNVDDTALWYCQQAFPFIINPSGSLRFRENNFSQVAPTESVTIDVGAPARTIFENNDLFSPNIRYCSGETNIAGNSGLAAESKVRGHGEWDIDPWPPQAIIRNGGWINSWLKGYSINQSPMRGYRPDPRTKPRLTPTQLGAVTSGPGALGSYPLLNGEAIYEVLDYNAGAESPIFARSAHQFYSYGQNLTTANVPGLGWSYKGQSSVVRMNANSLSLMFPGLKIILNSGADGDQSYMVTEVHFALGYIVVTRIDENNTVLVGTKTATFSGTVIKQEVYRIRQYP
jgi:Pectate lyase superfamily protein